jgi:hypothetical protein
MGSRWMTLLLGALPLAVAACEAPARASTEPQRTAAGSAHQRLHDLSMRVSFQAVELRQRLGRRFELTDHRDRPCPSTAPGLDSADPETAVLGFDVDDARAEGKTLLPSAFTETLSTPELDRLSAHFQGAGTLGATLDSAQAFQWLKSEADGAAALEELDRLRRHRYRAVYHVLEYTEANLIYSLRHNRREWTTPLASAWLAVHDVESGEALCQTLISARTDTEGFPVTRRTREEVRARLVLALGAELRRQALVALPRLDGRLRVPSGYGASPQPLTVVQR